MSGRRPAALVLVAVTAGLLLSAGILYARQQAFPPGPPPERLLYLRSGRTADRLMLSFDALAADVYWIRTIQHYGRDRKSSRPDRFALLYPLLDLTTTLDPHFNLAYRFGSIFLAAPPPDGLGRTDLALALLEKGLAANPGRWQYAYDAGFVHYWYTGDALEASRWFERGAALSGAPEWLAPLAATTRIQGGNRDEARRMLQSLQASADQYLRGTADRGLAQLDALDALDALNGLVQAFHARQGRYPASFAELAAAAGRRAFPPDPAGHPFVYDPVTHEVVLAPDSPLAPLPASMRRPGRRQ